MNRFSHVVLRPIPFERNNCLSLLFTFRQYRQSTKTLLILWIFRDGRLHDVLVACLIALPDGCWIYLHMSPLAISSTR